MMDCVVFGRIMIFLFKEFPNILKIFLCNFKYIVIWFFFIVEFPIVQILSNYYNVEIGKTVTVECQVQANPAHTSVQWKRVINGVTSDLDISNGNKYNGATVNTPSLTIQATTDNDEGYYICTATNAVGTGSSSQSYVDVTGSKLNFNRKVCLWMSVSSKKKLSQKILLHRKIDINCYTVQLVLTRTYLVPALFCNRQMFGLYRVN